MNRRWFVAILILALAASARGQYVEDSLDVGGALVGSLAYNSRANVVYGVSNTGLFFAISCDSNKVISNTVLDHPLNLAYDSLDNKAYVTQQTEGSESLVVFNGATHGRSGALPMTAAAVLLWDPDYDRLYVARGDADRVAVLDCRADTQICEIAVDGFPASLALNRRYGKLYVGSWYGSSISIVDVATCQVIRTVQLTITPECCWYSETADKYYVGGGGRVVVIDGSSDSLTGLILLPNGDVKALAGSELCERVVAGSYYGGSMDTAAVIDAQGDTVIAMLGVGRNPNVLAWSPTSGLFYCGNAASNNLAVIAGDGSRILGTVSVGDGPSSLLAVADAKRVYVGHFNTRFVYVVRDTASGVEERSTKAEVGLPMAVSPSHSAAGFAVSYSLTQACAVDISVLIVAGARVQVLATGIALAGAHRVEWTPASSLPTGLYFVRLEVQGRSTTRTVVLTH